MNFKMVAAALVAAITLFPVHSEAARKGAKIYNDYSIPKPDKPTNITAADLKLTDKYLDLYPEGIPEADAATLRKLYEYYKSDPVGKKVWAGLQEKALKCIPTWDMQKLTNKRYVYSLSNLKPLGKLYIFTGNELVSDFIRGHLAKAASLPVDFWIHHELRRLDPDKPKGCIETSYLNQALGTAIIAVKRNMTPEELKNIETAWYERGHRTAMNWMEANSTDGSMGNFLAVISTGILFSSKYFKDAEAWDCAVRGLKTYMDNGILSDGSDYEGYGYFEYPVNQILTAALVMPREEIEKLFSDSGIGKSQHWRVAGMLLGQDKGGFPSGIRITYGDNQYNRKAWGSVDYPSLLGTLVCKDGVAAWMRKTFSEKENENTLLFRAKFPNVEVNPTSPEEAGIPLLTTFESGDCYMRSGWSEDDMVLGLKARNGNKALERYPHARPEINSLTLGAFGEYLICTSGSASYRSHIRNEHDVRTWRANVLTVDGKDQLFRYKWMKKNGTYGLPDAQIIRKEILPNGEMILSNEARDAYATAMKQATRTVRYIPDGRFYIVTDTAVPEDGQTHHFDYRYFIFNHDDATVIGKKGNMIKVTRPNAELYIAVNGSTKLVQSQVDGYIHGPAVRDYDPDGPNQGKLGSAKGLVWSADAASLEVAAVLYPKHPGSAAPKIKFGNGTVTVNGKTYDLK